MRGFFVIYLSFVASALAYRVTTPSTSQGWTNVGAQPLTWERVDTDRSNFTAVLVNEALRFSQVLNALVDGTLLTTFVNPPSAGWPVGDDFRVNLVQDANNLNSILAQSSEFSIKPPIISSTTGSSTTKPTTFVAPANTPTTTNTDNTASPSDDINPSSTNAASPVLSAQFGFLSVFALLGFLFV